MDRKSIDLLNGSTCSCCGKHRVPLAIYHVPGKNIVICSEECLKKWDTQIKEFEAKAVCACGEKADPKFGTLVVVNHKPDDMEIVIDNTVMNKYFCSKKCSNKYSRLVSAIPEFEAKSLCTVCEDAVPRDKMKFCGACRNKSYCSRECQKKDWPRHKLVCGK